MPWIDPQRTRDAARHLRVVADDSDDLQSSIRRGLTLSDLPPRRSLAQLREIDEELTLLATVLTLRADAVEDYRIDGPAFGWSRSRETITTSRLFASLLDDEGARAPISGDLAIEVLLAHRSALECTADRRDRPDAFITIERLNEVANDAAQPAELRAAAGAFVANPAWIAQLRDDARNVALALISTRIPADAFAVEALQLFRRRNEVITMLVAQANRGLRDPTVSRFTPEELTSRGVEPEELRRLGLSADHGKLVIAAINNGTFLHSPRRAREFIASLPIEAAHGGFIDMFEVRPDSLRALHETATADLVGGDADLLTHLKIIAHLPESADGYRNHLITRAYAELGRRFEASINGDRAFDPSAPGHSGASWFIFGMAASDSVGPVIDGSLSVLGFVPVTNEARQDVANGNQAIFSDFTDGFEARLLGRTPDQPYLDAGFDLMDQAHDEVDPRRRQELMLTSSAYFGIHEQTIVDPYLSLPSTTIWQTAGGLLLTGLLGDVRTASEVMTDEGELHLRDADHRKLAPSLAIGSPILPIDDPNNLIADVDLCELLEDPFCSVVDQPNDWSKYLERMAPIGDVFKYHLTDPALFTAVQTYRPLMAPTPTDKRRFRPRPEAR